MSWPRDDAKLERVRALMAEHDLDALVVRAPDNVLYLTNFWGMKGYDACVFPREGDAGAHLPRGLGGGRRAHGLDGRRAPLQGLRPDRPAAADRARARARPRGRERATSRVGLELSLGTQAADRMVGEPTTFTRDWFTAFGDVADATPLLAAARAVKTEQEIERMRLANDIAAAAMEHCKLIIEPGMSEAQIAAEWEGFVHGEGTGWEGKVDLALGFSLVWSGPGIKTFTATTARPVVEGEPTLFEIWVCADGYWCDHTKNLVAGELTPAVPRARGAASWPCTRTRSRSRDPGASLAELDRRIRAGIEAMGFPGQPSHPICHGVGARAHEPPYAHQAGGGEIAAGMVLAIEPGCYIEGGGGLRVEDNFLVTDGGAEKLSPFPDGIVRA